ncbi:MAG: metalloregulator ArsR/SmtB family transcription factor [Rhizobium sp.]|nr:metalloregulator ArsR/SmtB family transcription factor [Rhizobium sp.]
MSFGKSNGPSWPTRSFATMFAAMANARRLQALHHLEKGESTVNDMAEAIGLTQSSVSQHLAVLRRCNLVKTRRNAQTIYYSLDSVALARILALLNEMFSEGPVATEHPDEYLDHSL